jgi:hypothetical protein
MPNKPYYKYNLNLGSTVGSITIRYNGNDPVNPIPVKFQVTWNGFSYTNGFKGSTAYNTELSLKGFTLASPYSSGATEDNLIFNKSLASPSSAVLEIFLPIYNSLADFRIICPAAPTATPTATPPGWTPDPTATPGPTATLSPTATPGPTATLGPTPTPGPPLPPKPPGPGGPTTHVHYCWNGDRGLNSPESANGLFSNFAFADDNDPGVGDHWVVEWCEIRYDDSVHALLTRRKQPCLYPGGTNISAFKFIGNPSGLSFNISSRGVFKTRSCGDCVDPETWYDIQSYINPSAFNNIKSCGGTSWEFYSLVAGYSGSSSFSQNQTGTPSVINLAHKPVRVESLSGRLYNSQSQLIQSFTTSVTNKTLVVDRIDQSTCITSGYLDTVNGVVHLNWQGSDPVSLVVSYSGGLSLPNGITGALGEYITFSTGVKLYQESVTYGELLSVAPNICTSNIYQARSVMLDLLYIQDYMTKFSPNLSSTIAQRRSQMPQPKDTGSTDDCCKSIDTQLVSPPCDESNGGWFPSDNCTCQEYLSNPNDPSMGGPFETESDCLSAMQNKNKKYVTVYCSSNAWQDTGVTINGSVSITATGVATWNESGGTATPDGLTDTGACLNYPGCSPMSGECHMKLIGRISGGSPFVVGSSYSGSPGSGTLELRQNDACVSDNSGTYSVIITTDCP